MKKVGNFSSVRIRESLAMNNLITAYDSLTIVTNIHVKLRVSYDFFDKDSLKQFY